MISIVACKEKKKQQEKTENETKLKESFPNHSKIKQIEYRT